LALTFFDHKRSNRLRMQPVLVRKLFGFITIFTLHPQAVQAASHPQAEQAA
jgi:hypothetical protein